MDSFGRVGVDDLVGVELNALKICSAGRHGRILGQVMVTARMTPVRAWLAGDRQTNEFDIISNCYATSDWSIDIAGDTQTDILDSFVWLRWRRLPIWR